MGPEYIKYFSDSTIDVSEIQSDFSIFVQYLLLHVDMHV